MELSASLRRVNVQPSLALALAVALLAFRVAYLNVPDILLDDSYISFRYARNLTQGLGLVFNPGERVEGYTNFLWTISLAGASLLGFQLESAAKLLAGLSAAGSLGVLYGFSRKLFEGGESGGLLAMMPVILFAAMGSQARHVLSGMETLFFVFWVSLAIYLYLYTNQALLAGLVFALAAMTRPEGVMYFGLTLLYGFTLENGLGRINRQQLNRLALMALGFSILYGAYFIWRYNYYGYLLPNTFYAKASGFSHLRLARGWEILQTLLSQWRIEIILALSLVGLIFGKKRTWFLFGGLTLATFAYFLYVGGDFIVWFGPRFLMPMLPGMLLLTTEGVRVLTEKTTIKEPLKKAIQVGIFGVLLVISLWYSWPGRFSRLEPLAIQMHGWAELGRWIGENTPPDTVIATDAAGLIPFHAKRYTIDMFGLTDLHIAHSTPGRFGAGIVAHEKYDPRYILDRQPDCIVSTWMDERGNAISAGLDGYTQEFDSVYKLQAVAKVREGPAQADNWIIETSFYGPDLYQQGYLSGIYCRETLH